jgi:hypothetical protein
VLLEIEKSSTPTPTPTWRDVGVDRNGMEWNGME